MFIRPESIADWSTLCSNKLEMGLGFGHTIYLPLTHSYVFNTKKMYIFEKMKNKKSWPHNEKQYEKRYLLHT